MAQISTGQKIFAVGRVAARQAGRSRWVRALFSAGEATLRSFGRVLHLLFLEITGVFFIAFAALGGYALSREYHAFAAGKIGPAKPLLALVFMLVFAWFGVTSFWRARRK